MATVLKLSLALAFGLSLSLQSLSAAQCSCPGERIFPNDPHVCGATLALITTYPVEPCARQIYWPPQFYPVGTSPGPGSGPNCPFTITVRDLEPPTNTCPANVTVTAASPSGATVTYPPPVAADNCPGMLENTCTPASGSTFSVGSTNVNCVVNKHSFPFPDPRDMASCQFLVKVLAADLSITNTGPSMITSGLPVTFTLTVHNNGPTEAPGITVINSLPPGLSAVGVIVTPAAAATCSGTTTVTCHFPVALASGLTATIEINADGRPSPGMLINTATISGTASDFNAANNDAVLSLQVSAAMSALSRSMLIALAAGMAAIALLRMR